MEEKTITKVRKKGSGGKRVGAGRKKGTKLVENPRTKHFTFGVSELTIRRANQLRELTKHDDMPFVDMLERWVADLAQEYGIE